MRLLTHILVALTVVLSTLSGLPCECIAAGASHASSEAAQAAEQGEAPSSCCAGNVQPEEPEDAEHDCPHCLSGGCDIDRADASEYALLIDDRTPVEHPASAGIALGSGSPTWPSAEPSVLEIALPPPPLVSASGWERCVRNQVIRR